MNYPKIDYSDLEQVEPVPGSKWEGWKIISRHRSNSDNCPNLLVFENSDGRCAAETFTDDGRDHIKGPPIIRNKPKRVTLKECWVIYFKSGHWRALAGEEEVDSYRRKGYIVRHIPAEVREV